jgi:hypothetical protein
MTRKPLSHTESDRIESEEHQQMSQRTTNRLSVGSTSAAARKASSTVLGGLSAALLVSVSALMLMAGGAQAVTRLQPATSSSVCGSLSVADASGSPGAPSDPCLISSDADLDTMLAAVNADAAHNGASTLSYELTANLNYAQDSSNTTNAATGNWSGIDWFSGTFDGDGYTISNIKYTSDSSATLIPGTDAAGSDLGFFRVLNDATVENMTLQNATVATTTANLSAGGVAVASFGSTVTGVSLTTPAISATGGGGSSFVGGLVGVAYANAFADDGSTTSDGGRSTFTDDSVSGGSISDANRTGGIAGIATGPTTIANDYVNTTLSNTVHPVDGTGGQTGFSYYTIGGLVGAVGVTYTTSGGSQAAGVAMTNDVIAGTIKGSASGQRSHSNGTNYASATVGWATNGTYTGTAAAWTASNWSTSNDLVSSAFTFTNETGSGLAGTDGTSVSPATLATESNYDGTASGLTDSSTGSSYNDLGWNFGAPDPSGWGWTGASSSGIPNVDANSGLAVSNPTILVPVNTEPSDATLITDAGATVTSGTVAIDTSAVTWSAAGSYQATLTAVGAIAAPVQVTVVVYTPGTVILADPSVTLAVSTTTPSDFSVLTDLGAALPPGATGPLTVDLTRSLPGDQAVQWDQSGSYTVTVSDTNAGDGLTPTTATIVITGQPVTNVANSTVYFNVANPPTASAVLAAVEPSLEDSQGDPITGTFSATLSTSPITAAGAYTASITGTDTNGIASDPVTVNVVVTDAAITVANNPAPIQATSTAPSSAAVASALGATVTNGSGQPVVDLDGTVSGDQTVNFDQPGEYQVTVSDSDASDVAAAITAKIEVVPVSVVTVQNPTIHFSTSNPPTSTAVLSAAGAEITDGSGNRVSGTLSASLPSGCAATAGSCAATITGTDLYGFAVGPVSVTVDVSAATVSLTSTTATFTATGSAPSQTALISALGATVTGSTNGGAPTADTSAVDWSVPGTYPVSVTDGIADDAANTVTASIRIVPVPVLTLPETTVYLPVNADDPLPAATLLANAGALLTDGQGNAIAGLLSADTSGVNGAVAGTYSAAITGTDQYGFKSAPVTVTVVMYLSAQQAGSVSITGSSAAGGTLTANLSGWAGLADPAYQWLLNGLPIPGATAATYVVTTADAGASISVEVSEAPQWYNYASATSDAVTIAALPATTTTGAGTTTTPSSTTTTAATTTVGATSPAATTKPAPKWTPAKVVLKPGATSTTIMEPTSLKTGTVLTVEVTEAGSKGASSARIKTAKVKVGKTDGYPGYSYKTGKLPVGTTTLRFYKKVGKRLVLVRTEVVTVSKKK